MKTQAIFLDILKSPQDADRDQIGMLRKMCNLLLIGTVGVLEAGLPLHDSWHSGEVTPRSLSVT